MLMERNSQPLPPVFISAFQVSCVCVCVCVCVYLVEESLIGILNLRNVALMI